GTARSDGACRDGGDHAGRRGAWLMAAARLHTVRHARTVPDVRGGDRAGTNADGRVWYDRSQGRGVSYLVPDHRRRAAQSSVRGDRRRAGRRMPGDPAGVLFTAAGAGEEIALPLARPIIDDQHFVEPGADELLELFMGGMWQISVAACRI